LAGHPVDPDFGVEGLFDRVPERLDPSVAEPPRPRASDHLFHNASPDPLCHLIQLFGRHRVTIPTEEDTEDVPSGEYEIVPREDLEVI
jgi:hypothetical protein